MGSKNPVASEKSFRFVASEITTKAKHWTQFKNRKLGSPEFEKAASELIARKVILPQIERVLIVPRNEQKDCPAFYFIFGYGDILVNDLYVLWNKETSEIQCLPFKINSTKKETLSTLETFKELNISKETGVPPWDDAGRRKIYQAHIEEIKLVLKKRKSFLRDKPLKIKTVRKLQDLEGFDLARLENSPSLKFASVVLSRFKNSSLILLHNVFDPRYKIKLEKSKVSLTHDPYTVAREFLKNIGIYSERRGGALERPGQLSQGEKNRLIEVLVSLCKQRGLFKPTRALVNEAHGMEGCEKPLTEYQIKDLIRKVKALVKI